VCELPKVQLNSDKHFEQVTATPKHRLYLRLATTEERGWDSIKAECRLNDVALLLLVLALRDDVVLVSTTWSQPSPAIDVYTRTYQHQHQLVIACQYAVFLPVPGRRSLRSTGTNRLLVPSGSRAFSVAGPKTWNAVPCQKMQHLPSLNTPFAVSSKRGFSRNLFRTSSSDPDCNLNLGLFVPTLRRFCRLRSTI